MYVLSGIQFNKEGFPVGEKNNIHVDENAGGFSTLTYGVYTKEEVICPRNIYTLNTIHYFSEKHGCMGEDRWQITIFWRNLPPPCI